MAYTMYSPEQFAQMVAALEELEAALLVEVERCAHKLPETRDYSGLEPIARSIEVLRTLLNSARATFYRHDLYYPGFLF